MSHLLKNENKVFFKSFKVFVIFVIITLFYLGINNYNGNKLKCYMPCKRL